MKSPVALLLIASMAYTSTAAPAKAAAFDVRQVPTVGSSGSGSRSIMTNVRDTTACIIKSLLRIDCSRHPGGLGDDLGGTLGGATGGLGGLTDGLDKGGATNRKGLIANTYNYSYETLDEETIQVKITPNRPGGGGDKTGKKGTEKQECTYNWRINGREISEIIEEAAARCIQ